MYTEISFPSLGLTMNPPRSIEIGSFSIYYYGILIALGMGLAVLYASRRSREFGIKPFTTWAPAPLPWGYTATRLPALSPMTAAVCSFPTLWT